MTAYDGKNWENYDEERMRSAISEIKNSPNLRFFFRSLLNALGADQTPRATDAFDTAYLCGRHEAAMDILATFREHDASLYPALLMEDYNETLERS